MDTVISVVRSSKLFGWLWRISCLILATSMVVIFTSCHSANVRNELAPPKAETHFPLPANYKPAGARQLTSVGENFEARFSPDGQNILYISRKRPSHTHSQVYTMDITSQRERRVTFQDGINSTPLYILNGKALIYASSTDEHKENPEYIHRALAEMTGAPNPTSPEVTDVWPPLELYRSQLDGNHIERLTHFPGFDSQPTIAANGSMVVFTSARLGGRLRLFRMDLGGSSLKPLITSQEEEHHSQPALSLDGRHLAWVRQKQQEAQILVGDSLAKTSLLITPSSAIHQHPQWLPDNERLIFSSNMTDGNFELYLVKKDGSCLQRLTYTRSDESNPSVSPDGGRVVFTSNRSEALQLYLMDLAPPSSCPESTL